MGRGGVSRAPPLDPPTGRSGGGSPLLMGFPRCDAVGRWLARAAARARASAEFPAAGGVASRVVTGRVTGLAFLSSVRATAFDSSGLRTVDSRLVARGLA